MMRALYTAATGMRAEQTNVDTIANNLSNVNTTGLRVRGQSLSLFYIRRYRPVLHPEMVMQSR